MNLNRQNWILAPMAMFAFVAFTFFYNDAPLHRIGSWALVLSMAWVLLRDYTDLGPQKAEWWLAGLYGALALSFLIFLPSGAEYLWWRIGGTLISLGLALYIVLRKLNH